MFSLLRPNDCPAQQQGHQAAPAAEPAWNREGAQTQIENRTVRVDFDASQAGIVLTDLRSGRRWLPAARQAAVPQVLATYRAANGQAILADMKTTAGPVRMVIEIQEPAEVLVRLLPNGQDRGQTLDYPGPFLPSGTGELVLPVDEGVLLPAASLVFPETRARFEYRQGGFLMPWFGLLEGQEGLMAMVETPYDLEFQVTGVAAPDSPGATRLSWGASWLPVRGRLEYERRVRFVLVDQGGYVAMAKRYRKSLIESGQFRTLADKARELPDVAKLIGAIDIHDRSPMRGAAGPDVLEWMISHGIRRALYYGPPDKVRNDRAIAAGYVTSRYEDEFDLDPPLQPSATDQAVVRADGSLMPGFRRPVGAKGGVVAAGQTHQTVEGARRCPLVQVPVLKARAPGDAARIGLRAQFLDVETALAPLECYAPQHPLVRAEDCRQRTALFDFLRSIGQIPGSEGGADWPAAALVYQEGSLTLNHFARLQGVYVGTAPFDLTQQYVGVQFDMAHRVPLHKLVYHDSVLMTWRWNHTPNRWVRGAEYWDDWDLLHILYGGMPIFAVDGQNIAAKGPRILQSYRNVCGVLEKIGGSEMLRHAFLTPDRSIQETQFANGWRVVVNFSRRVPYQEPAPGRLQVPVQSFAVVRSE